MTNTTSRHFFLLSFVFLLGLSFVTGNGAWAQGASSFLPGGDAVKTEEPAVPADALGRDTPRGMVNGFLEDMGKEDWEGAANFLDLSFLPRAQQKTRGPELASELQQLLNQGGWIMPSSMLSDDPAGKANDTIEPTTDRIGGLKARDNSVDLTAQLVKQPNGTSIWLISSETLKKVPAMVEEIKPSRLNRLLPDWLVTHKFYGVPLGHWIALLILACLAYFPAWVITKALGIVIARYRGEKRRVNKTHIYDAIELPMRLYMTVWIFVLAGAFVGISALARHYVSIVPVIVGWMSLILFISRLIDIVADRTQQHMSRKGKLGMFSVIYFVRRAAKFLFIASAILIILGTFGIDVRTALAALGIGGIALALGAQKTVENFVGSLMLVFDQPVRLGDFCKIGNTMGTVEDIGMRSTRLRTNDRTIVTIPNGEFSSLQIENYARRDRFLFNQTFGLRYETTPEQMRYLLVALRSMLLAHPKVSQAPARVRFIKMDTSSLNIEFFAYIMTTDNDDYMEVQEDLLLRIMDIVAQAGTGFAFPSQTLYMRRDVTAPEEKVKASEAEVQQWRDKGDLQLPKFAEEKIEALKDTIQYPPQGSISNKPKA